MLKLLLLPSLFVLAATWSAGPVLLAPGPPGSFDETAVKDPSIVFHAGRWHLFYTARGQGRYSLGYLSAASLDSLSGAPRHHLAQLSHAANPYAAAPQVFYFRPHRRWYLIYQTTDSNYQPVFSTNADVATPAAWTPPRLLLPKRDAAKWIDFWIICDNNSAYLFFTRDHRDLYVASAPLDRFPEGWSEPRRAFSPVHESAHIYRASGPKTQYLLLFETQKDDIRSYGLATASSLQGPWKETQRDFASGANLRFPSQPWTSEVSHGELLREGFDERLTVDPRRLRFLIQGLLPGAHHGPYADLSWRLGLITASR